MKKNILKATIVAAFALIAGFNVYNSQKSEVISGYGCIIKYTNGTYETFYGKYPN